MASVSGKLNAVLLTDNQIQKYKSTGLAMLEFLQVFVCAQCIERHTDHFAQMLHIM